MLGLSTLGTESKGQQAQHTFQEWPHIVTALLTQASRSTAGSAHATKFEHFRSRHPQRSIQKHSRLSMEPTWQMGSWELRSRRVMPAAFMPAQLKGRAVEPCRAISQRRGRLYAVIPRHRMLRLKFILASKSGSSSAKTCKCQPVKSWELTYAEFQLIAQTSY